MRAFGDALLLLAFRCVLRSTLFLEGKMILLRANLEHCHRTTTPALGAFVVMLAFGPAPNAYAQQAKQPIVLICTSDVGATAGAGQYYITIDLSAMTVTDVFVSNPPLTNPIRVASDQQIVWSENDTLNSKTFTPDRYSGRLITRIINASGVYSSGYTCQMHTKQF